MISVAQRKAFFRLFPRACDVQGVPDAKREEYRHRLIQEATGKPSLTLVAPGTEFDKLMYRLAQEAQDYTAAMKYATADGKRLATMCEMAVMQCFALAQEKDRDIYGYLKAILRQARMREVLTTRDAEWWLDLTLPQLNKLFQMLESYRRRLLHRVLAPNRVAVDRTGYQVAMPLKFDLYASYTFEGERCVMRLLDALPKPEIHVRIVDEEEVAYA